VEVITRAFYALKDTRTPVWVGVVAMVVNVVLSLSLVQVFGGLNWMPHGGLALANSLATGLEMCGLAWVLRGRLNGLALREMGSSLSKSTLATIGMGLAVAVWAWLVPAPNWLYGLGGALLGAIVYFGLALLLRSPEVAVLRSLRRPG
jgi:putative peptidoglycan lipid II flippase